MVLVLLDKVQRLALRSPRPADTQRLVETQRKNLQTVFIRRHQRRRLRRHLSVLANRHIDRLLFYAERPIKRLGSLPPRLRTESERNVIRPVCARQ